MSTDKKHSSKANTTKPPSQKPGLPKTGDTKNMSGVFGGLLISLRILLALLKKHY